MKKIGRWLCALIICISCEEIIEVDLNEEMPRLVVEANINWIKETRQTEQEIWLSTLSPYFSNETNPASGATVRIVDEAAKRYRFVEIENSGRYVALDTVPYRVNQNYTLHITYNQEEFEATETFQTVANITRVEQEQLNFFGREALKFEVYSFDPPEEENYTLFEFITPRFELPDLNVYRDDFTNGIEYYGILVDSEVEAGDTLQLRQLGLSPRGYNYWSLLVTQNLQGGGGPFQPPPVNLNGNVVNRTNPDRAPLGYFRISEVSELHYVVQ